MTRITDISPVRPGASLMIAWRLNGQKALVVGGGSVATGRVAKLLDSGAQVTVVAPALSPQLRKQLETGLFIWKKRAFLKTDVDGMAMVLSAVDDPETSNEVAQSCRAQNIPVNVADVPALCNFWFPSVHREGPIQISVLSNGKGPSISARLRRELARSIPAQASLAIERFGKLRIAIRAADPAPESSARRMSWLKAIGTHWSYPDLSDLSPGRIEELVQRYLAGEEAPHEPQSRCASARPDQGEVVVVGAGPGDPGLLTVHAREALDQADVVIADRLIPHAILDLVQGELRVARKYPGRSGAAQSELQRWVMEAAFEGKNVVRLKSGDPFVFGRTSEEIQSYESMNLSVRILPGISSALAAPLQAGIPTTLRGIADRFTVLTGQGADGAHVRVPDFDPKSTLILLMAVGRAESMSQNMMNRGYPVDLPVAIIERASQPDERVLLTSLERLADTIRRENTCAPAVIVIGEVVRHGNNPKAHRDIPNKTQLKRASS